MRNRNWVASAALAAAVLTAGGGMALATPGTQPDPHMPLDIVAACDADGNPTVIGQGRAPRTAQYTLSVWSDQYQMMVPIQHQFRQMEDIINLRPDPQLAADIFGQSSTMTFELSSPPPRDAKDDGAVPHQWVRKAVTAPVCA